MIMMIMVLTRSVYTNERKRRDSGIERLGTLPKVRMGIHPHLPYIIQSIEFHPKK